MENWLENPKNVYIGRNMSFYVKGAEKSKWHNPYTVKKFGIDKSLKLYEKYLLSNKQLMNDIGELKIKAMKNVMVIYF